MCTRFYFFMGYSFWAIKTTCLLIGLYLKGIDMKRELLIALTALVPSLVIAQPNVPNVPTVSSPGQPGGFQPPPNANPAGQVGSTRKPPLESNNGRSENYLPFSSNANASVDGKTIKYESSSGETTSKK